MSEETTSRKPPVDKVQVGNVQISIWKNESAKGDFFTASSPELRYRDEKTEEWKTGNSYKPMDLLALAEAAREASGVLRKLQAERGQGASRAA
jgi:hypothetical protein